MSRMKETLEDFLQNKNYSTPRNGTTYPSTDCIFNSAVDQPKPKSKNISTHLKTQSKPSTRLYSTSHTYGTDTYYKNVDINEHYVYEKNSNPDYYINEQITKKDNIRSTIQLKFPRTKREEKLTRYYEQYSNNCGDYITENEQDYYAYDCDPQAEYYTQEKKLKHDTVFIPKDTYCYMQPEYSIKASKPSKIPEYYPEYIDQEKKLLNYDYEDKQNKYYCNDIPQKIDNQAKPFLETIQNDANFYEKTEMNRFDPEISTIFERNNAGSTNTCTESSQTSNKSNKIEIRKCCSEETQTLEQDFANQINKSASLGTQTESNKKESATNTDEVKTLTSNCAESVIRWTRRIILYFTMTFYNNGSNLEHLIFPKILPVNKYIKDQDSPFLSPS